MFSETPLQPARGEKKRSSEVLHLMTRVVNQQAHYNNMMRTSNTRLVLRRFPLTIRHNKSLPLTCDVVEVVETVEVQAAGLFVAGFWTLAPHAGRPQDVRRPHAAIAPGAGLQNKNCASKKPQTKQQRYTRSPIKLSQTLLLLLLLD